MREPVRDKLRICIVTFFFAPIVGGAEVQAEKYARQFQAQGHTVSIVTLRYKKCWRKWEMLRGLPVTRIGGIYKKDGSLRIGRLGHIPIDLLALLHLWRTRHQYDLIYTAQLSPLTLVSALIGTLFHKPVVASIPSTGPGRIPKAEEASLMADTLTDTSFLRVPFADLSAGDIFYLTQTAFGGKIMVRLLQQSEAFYQVLSSRSRQYLLSQGFKAEKIVHIPVGVDTDQFYPEPKKRPDPAQPERDIVCIARLEYAKGIDVLLHAWYRMMGAPAAWRAHLQPRLLIAGDGSLEQQLQRIIQELGLQESVKLLGLQRDILPLLQQAWGFVLPSRWEGMPNALLEAMACGLPCLATKVSGSEDIITDGVTGLLVEPEQPEELAQALRRLITDSELAHTMAQEGRAAVVSNYQLVHATEQCIKLFQHALSEEQKALPVQLEGAKQ